MIGPGISDRSSGTRQEIARNWAQNYHFPMAPYDRESLPQVAQYLSIPQGLPLPRASWTVPCADPSRLRYGDELPPELLDEERIAKT